MKQTPTGSNPYPGDKIVGTLTFLESGVIDIYVSNSKDLDPLISSTFVMTSDFIIHALTKEDWITDYAHNYSWPSLDEKDSNTSKKKPSLTVIDGGKED